MEHPRDIKLSLFHLLNITTACVNARLDEVLVLYPVSSAGFFGFFFWEANAKSFVCLLF